MVMAILVVLGISISSNKEALVSAQCHVNVHDLISKCSKYVKKSGPQKDPSKECCDVVKKIDLPCACKHVTKDIEKIVSMKKVVYVGEFCGIKLRYGMKCGSK